MATSAGLAGLLADGALEAPEGMAYREGQRGCGDVTEATGQAAGDARAAVDHPNHPGHESGLVAREERADVGDLLHRRTASYDRRLDDRLGGLGRVRAHLGARLARFRRPGYDHHGADPVGSQLGGHPNVNDVAKPFVPP